MKQRYYVKSRWPKIGFILGGACIIGWAIIEPVKAFYLAVGILLACIILEFIVALAYMIPYAIRWIGGTTTHNLERDKYVSCKRVVALVHANGMLVPAPYKKSLYYNALDFVAWCEKTHPDWIEPNRDYLSPEERTHYFNECRRHGRKYIEI